MDTSQLYSTTSSGPAMGDPNQGSTGSSNSGGRRRRSREIETMSLEIRNYPRDLLQTFVLTDRNSAQQQSSAMGEQGEGGEEDLELNLGLSLGGRFGVDKSHRGLIRSSSVAGEIPSLREREEEPSTAKTAALARTSSLPTVTEEEWRRRKATLRRMEAKRRRSEKQRSMKEGSGSGAGEERESGLGLGFRGRLEREQQHLGIPGKLNPGSGHGLPGPQGKGKGGGFFRSLQGLLAHQQQLQGCSQGSVESQGGSSDGASELESKTHQGSGSVVEAKSPGSSQSMQMQERGSQETTMGTSSSSKQPETSDHRKKEVCASGVEDMPSVFTIGDGPTGRKVEGILYKYGKGEEVRIMCVCHGSFFSPAEFVKHAGGRVVDHPYRQIVVNPSSSPFP